MTMPTGAGRYRFYSILRTIFPLSGNQRIYVGLAEISDLLGRSIPPFPCHFPLFPLHAFPPLSPSFAPPPPSLPPYPPGGHATCFLTPLRFPMIPVEIIHTPLLRAGIAV